MYGFSLVTLEQSINNKMVKNGEQNLGWNVYYWYLLTLMQKFIVIL